MSVLDMEADENHLEAGPPTSIHMGGVSSKISYFQAKCPLYTISKNRRDHLQLLTTSS
jgi:hypothetical protein